MDSVLEDKIDSLNTFLDRRIGDLEKNMNIQFKLSQEMYDVRLIHVEESAGNAHFRLNEQKKTIECLLKYKNFSKGATAVLLIIVGIIGLKIFNIIMR